MAFRKILFISILFLIACNQHLQKNLQKENVTNNPTINFSLSGKQPLVYSTIEGTNDKISLTDTLTFESHPQPLETDVCVFVDPTHQFQTITGFGGAIVDASAETFAKLSKEKQDELLNKYYDTTD